MACISWRSDVLGCGRVCLIQWCLLLKDSAGSQTARLSGWLSARCHLMEMAEDCGSQTHYYRYILLSFLVSGISTFYRGDFWLTYRKLPPLPIILGTKIQGGGLLAEDCPVSQSLLIVLLKRKTVNGKLVYKEIPSDWFTMSQTFKNSQC